LRTDGHGAKHARRTGKALFAQIQAQGYRGGYSPVTDFIRAWREESVKDPTKAFVPLSFELGEALQFDWSEEAPAWSRWRATVTLFPANGRYTW